jgi:hypothetical protein
MFSWIFLKYCWGISFIDPFPTFMKTSVPDPNPDPDLHVFGPPGSGYTSRRYGSGSGFGSLYHQAKIVRKTLIPIVFVTSFGLFIFEKLRYVNVPSISNK